MPLLAAIRRTPLLWLLVFVPIVLAAERLRPDAHTALFVLSILAIVPPAALGAGEYTLVKASIAGAIVTNSSS